MIKLTRHEREDWPSRRLFCLLLSDVRATRRDEKRALLRVMAELPTPFSLKKRKNFKVEKERSGKRE